MTTASPPDSLIRGQAVGRRPDLRFLRPGGRAVSRQDLRFFCSGEPMTGLNSQTATSDGGDRSKSEAMRILVIEDDEATAAYMVKALTENGYVVDRVASG